MQDTDESTTALKQDVNRLTTMLSSTVAELARLRVRVQALEAKAAAPAAANCTLLPREASRPVQQVQSINSRDETDRRQLFLFSEDLLALFQEDGEDAVLVKLR